MIQPSSHHPLPWKHVLLTIIVLIALGALYVVLRDSIFAFSAKEFNQWISSLGWKAPLVIIALIIVEIVIPPLPGGWLGFATGYLFGPWLGFVYSYIGSVIGSFLLFNITKRFGQPFIRAMMPVSIYEHYGVKLHHIRLAIAMLYAIPLFPVDMLTMLLGLTPISRKKFSLLMLIGFIPNTLALNFLGTTISGPDNQYSYVFLGLLGITILYILGNWLKHRFFTSADA